MLFLLGIIILITIVTIYLFKVKNKNKNNIDYVLPRFYENIDWIYDYPELNFYVYNKGEDIKLKNDKIKLIALDNIGRDGHTILYHIINNYDNLANVTIFGSACSNSNEPKKLKKVRKTIKLVKETNNSVFLSSILSGSDVDYIMKFYINRYESTHNINKLHSNDILEICPIRPFRKWFYHIWKEFKVNWVCFNMIFAVHRNHIIQHPKSYYEYLMSFVNKSSNPEAGHYMERATTSIFYPYPESCVYNLEPLAI
jgi:hypothetical protein